MTYSLSNLDPDMLEEIRDELIIGAGRRKFLNRLQLFLSGESASAAEKDLAFSLGAELNAAGVVSLLPNEELAIALQYQRWPKVASFLDGLPSSLRSEISRLIFANARKKRTSGRPSRHIGKSLAAHSLDKQDTSERVKSWASSAEVDGNEPVLFSTKTLVSPRLKRLYGSYATTVVAAPKIEKKTSSVAASQVSAKGHASTKKHKVVKGYAGRPSRSKSSP